MEWIVVLFFSIAILLSQYAVVSYIHNKIGVRIEVTEGFMHDSNELINFGVFGIVGTAILSIVFLCIKFEFDTLGSLCGLSSVLASSVLVWSQVGIPPRVLTSPKEIEFNIVLLWWCNVFMFVSLLGLVGCKLESVANKLTHTKYG